MSNKPPASILISSIRLIGDVILTTPLISLLHKAFPDAAIDLLVADGTGDFLRKDPRVRNVLTAQSKQVAPGSKNRSSLGLLYSIFRRYDLAITMNASDRGALAVACAGRLHRIGFYENSGFLKNFWKKLLLSKVLYYDTSSHVVQHCRQIAESLGLQVNRLEVSIYWDDKDRDAVENKLQSLPPSAPYVVMHPFARWEYKYWDMDSFAQLNDRIAAAYNVVPVWTSSPDPKECELLENCAEKCHVPPLLLPGSLTLNQMACLISGAELYIGLDTAITHIAASTDVPVVALYGPTPHYRWFPWNNSGALDQLQNMPRGDQRNGSIIMIQETCESTDCIRPDCSNPCMARIKMQDVYAAAAILLEEKGFLENTACCREVSSDA